MAINWQMERQNSNDHGILFSKRKELSTGTVCDLDEPQRYALEKKLDTRDHILYSLFM